MRTVRSSRCMHRTAVRPGNEELSRTVGRVGEYPRGGGSALKLAAAGGRTTDRAVAQASNAARRAVLAIDAAARSQHQLANRPPFAFDAGALPGGQRAVALLFTMPRAGRAAAPRANGVALAPQRARGRPAGLRLPGAVVSWTLVGAPVARLLVVESKRAIAGQGAHDRQQRQAAEQRSHSRDARDAWTSIKRRRSARALSAN